MNECNQNRKMRIVAYRERLSFVGNTAEYLIFSGHGVRFRRCIFCYKISSHEIAVPGNTGSCVDKACRSSTRSVIIEMLYMF